MAFQLDGIDVTGINIDGQPVTELQLDGVTVWTSGPPPELELIQFYPTTAPSSPEIGDIYYELSESSAKIWDGSTWNIH